MDFFRKRACQIEVTKINASIKMPYLENVQKTDRQARGSGFVIKDKESGKKFIVTNFHVVADATDIHVIFPSNETKIRTELVCADPYYDLVLLEVPDSILNKVEHIELGESYGLTGDIVLYAVGYPCGLEDIQIQQGKKTGYHVTDKDIYIQHAAALNPGNSGGALTIRNNKFEYVVVGINNAIIAGANSIDFSIPVERLKLLLQNFKEINTKLIPRFDLGIDVQDGNDDLRTLFNIDDSITGVRVKKNYANSISDDVLFENDFITSINGFGIADNGRVYDPKRSTSYAFEILASYEEKDEHIELEIYRDGELLSVEIRSDLVDSRPIKSIRQPYEKIDYEIVSGIVFEDISYNSIAEFNHSIREGIVIVNIIPQGNIAHTPQKDIARVGTIVTSVNSIRVTSLYDLRKILSKNPEYIILKTENDDLISIHKEVFHDDNDWIKGAYGPKAVFRFKVVEDISDPILEKLHKTIERTELEDIEKEFLDLISN